MKQIILQPNMYWQAIEDNKHDFFSHCWFYEEPDPFPNPRIARYAFPDYKLDVGDKIIVITALEYDNYSPDTDRSARWDLLNYTFFAADQDELMNPSSVDGKATQYMIQHWGIMFESEETGCFFNSLIKPAKYVADKENKKITFLENLKYDYSPKAYRQWAKR